MALYTSDYLKSKVRNKSITEKEKLFSTSINEGKKFFPSFDIFLSHSFLDKEDVQGLYIELTEKGYKVYVDWIIDPHLNRANVTKESATLIRNRMKSSKSLLLAISVNAAVSKWMPWELGFMDGFNSNCAIVPVSDLYTAPKSYKGVEYLSLYPYITRTDEPYGFPDELVAVEDSDKYIELNEMVFKGSKPVLRSKKLF